MTLDIYRLSAANNAGETWAKALKVGDTFEGAGPAAEAHGFEGAYRRAFIFAALGELERVKLFTERDSLIITRLDRP